MVKIIRLGAGKIYIAEYVAATGVPEDNVIETDANRIGATQGGATIEYTPTFYDCHDDLGEISENSLTAEDAHLKTAVMTFNASTLAKLIATGRLTEDATKRTLLIGGINNDNLKKYVIRFVHEDSVKGDLRATIIGRNVGGVSMAFTQEKETLVNVDFKAFTGMDTNGTLVKIEEEIPA